MPFHHLEFEVDGEGIATATVNRPEKLNALNQAVMADLAELVNRIGQDPSIKGLILTGAGEKAFVAGADIRELAALSPVEAEGMSRRGQAILRSLEQARVPVAAAINGFALGGGLELAMACTVRFAAPEARLGQPEVKLGIVAGYGGTQRLPRLIGRGRALELLLSGDPVDAAEAHRIGLVNAIAPRSELIEFAKAWLRKVAANGPLAVALTMKAVDAADEMELDAGLKYEAAAFALSAATEDRREGTAAFLEKRKPVFTGK